MKLPAIPLPGPVFMIDITRGNDKERRVMIGTLRFLLWAVPSGAVDYALAVADGGRHAHWLNVLAAFAVLAIAVLLVGVQDAGKDPS